MTYPGEKTIIKMADSIGRDLSEYYFDHPGAKPEDCLKDGHLTESFLSLFPILLSLVDGRKEYLPQMAAQLFSQRLPELENKAVSMFCIDAVQAFCQSYLKGELTLRPDILQERKVVSAEINKEELSKKRELPPERELAQEQQGSKEQALPPSQKQELLQEQDGQQDQIAFDSTGKDVISISSIRYYTKKAEAGKRKQDPDKGEMNKETGKEAAAEKPAVQAGEAKAAGQRAAANIEAAKTVTEQAAANAEEEELAAEHAKAVIAPLPEMQQAPELENIVPAALEPEAPVISEAEIKIGLKSEKEIDPEYRLLRLLSWSFPGETVLLNWPFRSYLFEAYLPRLRLAVKLGEPPRTPSQTGLWLKKENITVIWITNRMLKDPVGLRRQLKLAVGKADHQGVGYFRKLVLSEGKEDSKDYEEALEAKPLFDLTAEIEKTMAGSEKAGALIKKKSIADFRRAGRNF